MQNCKQKSQKIFHGPKFHGDLMSLQEVRSRIENMKNDKLRIIAKFQLLTACRVSEAVGKYAVRKDDLVFTNYKGNELALFNLRTAKRQGTLRTIALPVNQVWLDEIVEYFKNSRGKKVFKYGESSVTHLLANEFNGLKYFIERYTLKPNYIAIPRHEREMRSHALRHLRLSELVNVYGFDYLDLATFAGWKMAGMASRYVTMAWGRYIDKFLKI